MIEVRGLTFDYPTRRALEDVNFSIEPGSVTALVGPNGAGKTTLLRCIAGLGQPMLGAIEVHGVDVLARPREAHVHLGYLSDFFGLYDELSVRRGLEYMAWSRGAHSVDVREVAARLGLADHLESLAGQLSRGLRQRLAIAQAIVHRPAVLLLDEPASGLDPEARLQLGDLFRELHRAGMTLLVSSHILAELEHYASDILILDAGRVIDQHGVRAERPTRSIELTLSRPSPDLDVALRRQDGVGEVHAEGLSARFDFTGDPEAQQNLLAVLVREGHPVCSFAERRDSLQDAYLSRMRRPS